MIASSEENTVLCSDGEVKMTQKPLSPPCGVVSYVFTTHIDNHLIHIEVVVLYTLV